MYSAWAGHVCMRRLDDCGGVMAHRQYLVITRPCPVALLKSGPVTRNETISRNPFPQLGKPAYCREWPFVLEGPLYRQRSTGEA